ncbi:hypothetical protein IT893_05475 [Thalassospira sp. A40-3]|uniref:HAD family hydrolase n=1 Tax=Thalassospira sp. A40-3 TaxID=2785908 RepID=UPI0018CDB975|nr:HAD family hydrolase [Thalassospira sp. A40-3]QPO12967.1 hypothetical protein IT893_05475 [Thalassospira sp. A40-3]
MHSLKLVIFSLRDVLVSKGTIDNEKLSETVKLFKFLVSKGIDIALVSNSHWTVRPANKSFQQFISELVGTEIPYFQGGVHIPYKQRPQAMKTVLDNYGVSKQEAVYVGSTDHDMQAARNGGLLFLNANWHAQNSKYGFDFASPLEIGKFIDCCCDPEDWFWKIEEEGLRIYSIAPLAEFSKRYPEAAGYSSSAKSATKFSIGDLRFWGLVMAARLHFSGLGAEVNYVTPYPGHKTTSQKTLLTNALKVVSGSLQAQYLDDLIIRHTDAQKSQLLRKQGIAPDHRNQLSTICLRRDPVRTGPKQLRYKSPPLKKGKKVLLIDDICTQGFSSEAARSFIEATGAEMIAVTWLKTPGNNDFQQIRQLAPEIKKPYSPYSPEQVKYRLRSFDTHISNPNAPKSVAESFSRYQNWDWP